MRFKDDLAQLVHQLDDAIDRDRKSRRRQKGVTEYRKLTVVLDGEGVYEVSKTTGVDVDIGADDPLGRADADVGVDVNKERQRNMTCQFHVEMEGGWNELGRGAEGES